MNYLIVLPLLAAAVLAAPLYPADVFRGELAPFAYSAYQPAFYHEAFAPNFGYNYFGPSRHFSDYTVASPITYAAAAPITQYVHVPVVAPQVKYVEVPVPTPVIEKKVVPEVKTVVVTKVVESTPALAPVQSDSRESAESVEIDSRED